MRRKNDNLTKAFCSVVNQTFLVFLGHPVYEKITIERREMAHSIRLEKLYHVNKKKNFTFDVSDHLKLNIQNLNNPILAIFKQPIFKFLVSFRMIKYFG